MGREVKRVPLNFEWPIGKVWEGYLLPDELDEQQCRSCGSRGSTPARQWVEQMAALCLLLNNDLRSQEQGRPMHPYFDDTGSRADMRPTPDIAEFTIGLAGRGVPGDFHDSIDNWRATEKLIQAAGLDPETWGICAACAGHGSVEKYPGQRAEAEAWEPTEPPTGEGWQLWSTTSEGDPMTPAFPTREALARHCAENGVSWFGDRTATYEQWLGVCDGALALTTIAPGVVIL